MEVRCRNQQIKDFELNFQNFVSRHESSRRLALRIGMFIPRGVGDPRRFGPPNHKAIVRYGQRADDLGFDSLWRAEATGLGDKIHE